MTLDEKLNNAFEEMMDYRRSVGYATATYRSSVPPFINFCIENHPEALRITREMVNEWLNHYPYSANSKAAFISLLREYTKYLNFLGHDDFIPDEDYTVKRIAFNPYLFTDTELSGLFNAIDLYTGKTCGKRYLPEVVLPVYSRMLYCCGLRPQEPPAIRTEDVDLETGDVYIRQSKRHKDRHIRLASLGVGKFDLKPPLTVFCCPKLFGTSYSVVRFTDERREYSEWEYGRIE
jgi:integrase